MATAISAVITVLMVCGACLSQQDQKSFQQPPAITTHPELHTRAKASDGVAAFDVGKFPIGVVSDGTNIWVANGESNNVMKLRATDGAVLGTFNVGTNPEGVVFDGTNVWVVNTDSNTVSKLRASDGAVLGTELKRASKKPYLSVTFSGFRVSDHPRGRWLGILGRFSSHDSPTWDVVHLSNCS